jgi:zinc transport system substrate-binding protein
MNRTNLFISLLLLMVSCKPADNSPDKLVISVSILPQQYFIERIAGDMVEVNVMIPPGTSPATYEPTVAQLSKLDQSPVYMKIGDVGFELAWLPKIRSVNPDMKIVDLSRGIEPILEEDDHHEAQDHTHGGSDPHIWMSALNAKIIAENIYNELLLQFPDENELLSVRHSELAKELDSLHLILTHLLSDKKTRSFMIYHPALSYFARDYDLVQYPLEIGGKTPSPAHMKRMIDLGNERGISTIFIQKQFDRKNAQVLANEIGAKIVQIDPLDPDWPGQMIYIATQLRSSL